jgi:hypothetical protein
MLAVETNKLTANLVATRQETVNPGVGYRITRSREILVPEKTLAHRSWHFWWARPRGTVEIFLSRREFAGCKACAEVVESSWESFGQNVYESSRSLFCVMPSALIRSYAWKSTSHLRQKFSTGRHAATFSTNPQRSSQQQGSIFYF